MRGYFGSRSLGAQITLLALLLIAAIFGVVTVAGGLYGRSAMRSKSQTELRRQAAVASRMLEFYYRSLENQATDYGKIFSDGMKSVGVVSVDRANHKAVGPFKKAPVVRAGYQTLDNNPFFVDRFAKQTGGQASVLVRMDDQLVRITTSLKDADGKRANGTVLDPDLPAYRSLMAGKPYVGLTRLFGESYMTHYEPIMDDSGKVDAVLAVAVDYSAQFAQLRKTVSGLTFGRTGSAFAIRRTGDHAVRIHRDSDVQGKPLARTPFMPPKDVLARWLGDKPGVATFTAAGKQRLVAFQPVAGWNWTLVAGGPLNEFEAAGNRFAGLLSVICVAGGLALLLALFFGVRLLLRPLRTLRERVGRLGEGDLTVRFAEEGERDARSRNEIVELQGDLEMTTEKFRDLIRRILGSAGQVADSAGNLLEVTRQSSTGAEAQQEETDQVATAMTQMSQTVQEVARNAADASTAASEADAQANDGRSLVEQTEAAIEAFVSEIQAASESIEDVRNESERIGSVIELINGISEQTNLLALNAAIEAARAGEQGRGFAVVADEVRSLAGRTQSATEEVKSVIESLQSRTEDAVGRMTRGRTAGDETAERSRKAAEALASITEAFSRITALTTEIATAAEEQTQVAENINESTVRIRDLSRETAGYTQRATEAGRDLEETANTLNRQVRTFRVEDD